MNKNEIRAGSILENEHDYIVKVVIVGDSAVGKTNIISRYAKNEFTEKTKATIGCEFANKTISVVNTKIKLQIWDTAGQERFRAITNSFYLYSKGVMLVFDLNNPNTFKSLPSWLNDIEKNIGNDASILILGNKSDLAEEGKRKIDKNEIEEFCKKNSKYCNIINRG